MLAETDPCALDYQIPNDCAPEEPILVPVCELEVQQTFYSQKSHTNKKNI